jgi:hypothetical protein
LLLPLVERNIGKQPREPIVADLVPDSDRYSSDDHILLLPLDSANIQNIGESSFVVDSYLALDAITVMKATLDRLTSLRVAELGGQFQHNLCPSSVLELVKMLLCVLGSLGITLDQRDSSLFINPTGGGMSETIQLASNFPNVNLFCSDIGSGETSRRNI